MPDWHEQLAIFQKIERDAQHAVGHMFDNLRRKYLKDLHKITGRNVIIYYSGWLQKPAAPNNQIQDGDKGGFMTCMHGLDTKKGLDLVLHTPGGAIAATESLVDYLRSIFGTNIRAVVPPLPWGRDGKWIALCTVDAYNGIDRLVSAPIVFWWGIITCPAATVLQ